MRQARRDRGKILEAESGWRQRGKAWRATRHARAGISLFTWGNSRFTAKMKKIIATNEAPAAVGPYSQAVAVGNFLFCAGQIPLDPATNELVPGGVTEQTTRVCENIRAVLA